MIRESWLDDKTDRLLATIDYRNNNLPIDKGMKEILNKCYSCIIYWKTRAKVAEAEQANLEKENLKLRNKAFDKIRDFFV